MPSATIITPLAASLLSAAEAGDQAAIDKAFDALKTYDFGQDQKVLAPLDAAVIAAQRDPAAREKLETLLTAVLGTDASRAAKDYACRKLKLIGTAKSASALAALLGDKDLTHMARFALEENESPEAAAALRAALTKASGAARSGIITSIGSRRDPAGVAAIAPMVNDNDPQVAAAAVHAIGRIGNEAAASLLSLALSKAPAEQKPVVADALLICAEQLLADGKKTEALAAYKLLSSPDLPKNIGLAAKRGLLAVMGKKE